MMFCVHILTPIVSRMSESFIAVATFMLRWFEKNHRGCYIVKHMPRCFMWYLYSWGFSPVWYKSILWDFDITIAKLANNLFIEFPQFLHIKEIVYLNIWLINAPKRKLCTSQDCNFIYTITAFVWLFSCVN